jgi:hypothetical protein
MFAFKDSDEEAANSPKEKTPSPQKDKTEEEEEVPKFNFGGGKVIESPRKIDKT